MSNHKRDTMCLEYYPECTDEGDDCCERSLESPLDTLRPSTDDYCGSPWCHFHLALVQLECT